MKRFFIAMCLTAATFAQSSPAKTTDTVAVRPLPDLPTLFGDIVKHQKELDLIRKNYMFHEDSREEEFDGDGRVKKTTLEERETFYIGRRQVSRLLRKDGRDL